MHGSLPLSLKRPTPLELLVRLLLATFLVLWPVRAWEGQIVARLLPALTTMIPVLDPTFTVLDFNVTHQGASERARVRANLAHPVQLSNRVLEPLVGWLQVDLTVGGAVAYSAFAFIVVLAWPASTPVELGVRLIATVPVALLLLIHVPLTFIAELWNAIYQTFEPGRSSALLQLTRFLMGGGGFAIAGALAMMTIVLVADRSAAGPLE